MAEQLLAGELEGVVRAVVTAAIGGDMQAAGLILGRMLPVRRGRPVCVPMPVVRTAADALAAVSAVTAAVAAGDVTPDEAATLASLAETAVRVVAVAQLESRIVALETARDQGERTDR